MNLPDSWTDRPVAIVRRNAAETVFEDLCSAIENGDLPVGVKLPPEAALAERYGVSRSVIREALRSCQTLGLTETKTGSGTVVISAHAATPHYGRFSARDLVEARPYIEVPAAGWAARRRTEAQLAELTSIVDRMEGEVDPARWVRLDTEFHLGIAKASGNEVFATVVAAIRGALSMQSRMLNASIHERRAASNREHRRILDAIASGDFADASDAMRQHLDRVEDAVNKLATITP
ncbi:MULTISPECIES: FadR/GntR family transcriptional regulator [Mycolicibacterium]|uniref:GntR family transcriptional regulator n=1 Tax=Mycolicibacterium mageritense TaxID=53462 RepID=A0AAI8TVA4_MYCME|nr:FadR/GntR family transcriptional regulator [Mycolicibacterium mageritense]MBN3459343.1 FadR family transcriptional regulator [Mycobacterium sp. DSM 3803]OKH82878.1 GntR family transcriptional regulator [Mycobacterium sp. SWH-M3]MCC9185660.1 FadR family transcriptional regulator [Mycolicibacterium mageritense]CDO23338.1 GntR family transcriptional regulator [Mycolicibacterium mageritense DSM 44476 = CIP 104973]BBX32114.1 GntR family transcriptional regulator [Mycolicibacterium mageritense]